MQLLLYSQVAAEFSIHKLGNTSLDLREVVGMEQLMFILKEYYSLSPSQTSDIRPYILLIAKQFVARVSKEEEWYCIHSATKKSSLFWEIL